MARKCQYDIGIKPAENGYIVSVGCRTLVIEAANTDKMLADIKTLLVGGREGEKALMLKYILDGEPALHEPEPCERYNGEVEQTAQAARQNY